MITHPPILTAAPDERRFPQLTTDATADVVVVGGGVVGVLTAWALVERGASVILLEKSHLLAGETAYTTGFLSRVPDAPLVKLRQRYGSAYLRELIAAGREAQEWVFGLLANRPAASLQRCDSFIFSSRADDPSIVAAWEAVADLDPATERVATPPASAALRVRDEGHAELRPGLLALLTPLPAALRVYEESSVREVRVERRDVRVATAGGVVTARAAILATGNASSLVPALSPLLRTAVTYVSAVRYVAEAPLPEGLWWDTGEPYHYLRRIDARTIMIGGEDEFLPRPQGQQRRQPHQGLEDFVRGWLPGAFAVTHRWSGTLYYSPDELPLVGTDPQRGPAVAYATALAGNGLLYGALTARMLAAQATGGHHAAAALFDPVRFQRPPVS